MATYTVPQDVEADDKLIGPFSFRQFVYLMISAGLGFVAFVLFQIFPLLVIIPIPFIIFLVILALPLKKDQPMETYLSAVVDFYLKPNKRTWMPGQSDTSITITAPKNVEKEVVRDISREEASRRLSFLAEIADTEGRAIKDGYTDDTQDMFTEGQNTTLERSLERSEDDHRNLLLQQMRQNITSASTEPVNFSPLPTTDTAGPSAVPTPVAPVDISASSATIQPDMEEIHDALAHPADEEEDLAAVVAPSLIKERYSFDSESAVAEAEAETAAAEAIAPEITPEPEPESAPESIQIPDIPEPESAPTSTPEPVEAVPPTPSTRLADLAENTDFSIATISHEANREQDNQSSDNQEPYISLH